MHPDNLNQYLAEQFQAETELRDIQQTRAHFEMFALALASLIGFLAGLAVAA